VSVRTISEEIEETVVQWYRIRQSVSKSGFLDSLDRLYNIVCMSPIAFKFLGVIIAPEITSTLTLVMISLVLTTIGIKVPELGLK